MIKKNSVKKIHLFHFNLSSLCSYRLLSLSLFLSFPTLSSITQNSSFAQQAPLLSTDGMLRCGAVPSSKSPMSIRITYRFIYMGRYLYAYMWVPNWVPQIDRLITLNLYPCEIICHESWSLLRSHLLTRFVSLPSGMHHVKYTYTYMYTKSTRALSVSQVRLKHDSTQLKSCTFDAAKSMLYLEKEEWIE